MAGRLDSLVQLILQWRGTLRLVGTATADEIWSRHVADSLRLAAFVPRTTPHAADIGSGAGFPGLVLAIATGIPFALIERDRRKAAFLVEACRVTQAPAHVVARDVTSAALPPQPLITARAFAPLPKLLDAIAPLMAPHGVALLQKGKSLDEELRVAARRHTMIARVHLTDTRAGYVLECRHIGS